MGSSGFIFLLSEELSCVSGERDNLRLLYVASLNLASYDNFLGEKSLAAFAMFRGQYQQTPLALPMSSELAWLLLCPFVDEQQPEHSIRLFQMLYLIHRSHQPCPRIPAVSICQASSASAEISSCAAVQF